MSNDRRDDTNYYEVLEVAPDAPQTEIHKAYQRAKATYTQGNPALYSMFSHEEARELIKLIEEAYEVLGNQARRNTYDDTIRSKMTSLGRIESEHKALPDFAMNATSHSSTRSANVGGVTNQMNAKAKQDLPPGTGRTQLSTYSINQQFENELAEMTEFDGAVLQRVREYKNIGLDKLSDATRVSRTYLMAVEGNDYKSLPAAVFVRGFVVQMARIMGLDETKVAASYMKQFKAGGGK